jgi:hypothetical protein
MTSNPNMNLESRLASLGGSVGDDSDFVQQVLNQIERENIRPDRSASMELKGRMMRSAIGLAAAILIGTAIWSIFIETPRPAYGIEGVVGRVLSLNSLHLKGVVYVTGSACPIELFAQQPDRCRVSRPADQSGRSGIASTDTIITADQHITLDAHAKIATIQSEDSEDARGQVAEILQSEVQMMFGAAKNFTKARSETLNGIQTDVYESRIESIMRDEIWFNPKTGLPVKTVVYQTEAGQPDRILGEFDTIEPNPQIDPAVFKPAIPSGYVVVHPKPPSALFPELTYGGFTVGHFHFSNRLLIALNNGNILACWCLFDEQNPGKDLDVPDANTTMTIKSTDDVSYSEHLLRADPTPSGYHWRWSLLRPTTPTQEGVLISWSAEHDHDNSQNIKFPIVYKPQDLPDRVINLQKQTLPPGGEPMTLGEIESGGR